MKEIKGNVDFKFKSLSEKSVDGLDKIIIEGYGSVNTKDRDGDVVIQYGIDMANFKKNPIILYQHDRHQPAGKVVKAEINEKGLYVQAEVYKEVNPQAYYAVKSGVVSMFSIGFKGLDGEYNEDTDTFYFTKSELLEISLVSIPANQDAKFAVVETPCGDGFCLANKSYTPEKVNNKQEQDNNKGEEVTEELLKELIATQKEMLTLMVGKEEKSEEPKEEVKEEIVEEVKEEKPEEVKEIKQEEPEEAIKNLEITEANFEEMLAIKEDLESKLNTFLKEQLQ
jgi:HK97 family phage prohead protease